MPEPRIEPIRHLLDRIARDPRLAYHFDFFSRSMELLTEEYARQTGLDLEEFRRNYYAKLTFEAPKRLETALLASVQLIRDWHGMHSQSADAERATWRIYYEKSPEMEEIRKVFPEDPTHGWIVDTAEVAADAQL